MKETSEKDLINIIRAEMRASIGFENDDELVQLRAKAMEYRLGEMKDLKPALKNRSRAMTSDVSDAIETAKPDIVEILTGDEDVIYFRPQGPEDEDAARQETDYVFHVLFNENDGWSIITSGIDDALSQKTAVTQVWWEETTPEPTVYRGKTPDELAVLQQQYPESEFEENEDGTFDVTVNAQPKGRVCIQAVDPNDFTIARDATRVHDATYCAVRSRPRLQDLKQAYDLTDEQCEMLPAYTPHEDNEAKEARDTVNEDEEGVEGSMGALRNVEVIQHYIQIVEDGVKKRWKVLTDAEAKVELHKEEVNRVPLAAGTPFPMPHRFYGRSLADLLMEIQRIKTSLLRMGVDNWNFAINRRPYVDTTMITPDTMPDLLNNEPARPIRGKGPNAISFPQGGALDFDVFSGLEYVSTMAEQRSGIVRNAQGLNPDTLHDTASGQQALMAMAQKRLRFIARNLAETWFKGLVLLVHATLSENAKQQAVVRLRSKWVTVDPSSWGVRNDMAIEIGVGASGREFDILAAQQIGVVQEKFVAAQGGMDGPLTNPQSLNATAMRLATKLGFKDPERYFPDPAQYQPPQPQPDPKAIEAQAKAEVEQQRLQIEQQRLQFDAQKAMADEQFRRDQLTEQTRLKELEVEKRDTFDRDKLAAEVELDQSQFEARLTFERETLAINTALKKETEASAPPTNTQVGGDDL